MVLTRIPGLPATVVGVEARERVTAEDYESVLIPAVEAAAAASSDGKVRVLYVLGREFPDFTAGAVWADTKLALGPRRRWERIAVVSDAVWLRRAIRVVGWAIPGEVRVYASDQLDDARVWVTSPRRVSGARRFFGDVIIGFRVLNEMRHRVWLWCLERRGVGVRTSSRSSCWHRLGTPSTVSSQRPARRCARCDPARPSLRTRSSLPAC